MKKHSYSLLLSFLFVLLLLFPDISKAGASEGLSLWYSSVVPILFPFLILSNLMILNNSFSWFLQPFFKIQTWVPSFNPWYFYALILGFFCGYPMGAKAVSDLIQTKKLSLSEGKELLPVVNQASPMFLAGYLGIHIFENRLSFSQIMFFIYLPPMAAFCFLLLKSFFPKRRKTFSASSVSVTNKKNSMSPSMEHTIWDSFFILVTIGVYMMLFTILSHLCQLLLPGSVFLSIATCFLEFSTGLNRLKQIVSIPEAVRDSLLLALASFGGLCTAAQTYSIVGNTGIPLKYYLMKKIFLAVLVFFLSYSSFVSS